MRTLAAVIFLIACNQLQAQDSGYPMAQGKAGQSSKDCPTISSCRTPEQVAADEARAAEFRKEVEKHGGMKGYGEWLKQQNEEAAAQRRATAAQEAAAASNRVKITIGMTEDQVLHEVGGKWAYPSKRNKTQSAHGLREQWVYADVYGMPMYYLYFDNGVLTTIEE